MSYDLNALSRTTGFEPRLLETVLRTSDILRLISQVHYLQGRLSIYGGTALNFIHFRDIPRLSFDLDFNYRQPTGADWGAERDEIDKLLKQQLDKMEYHDIRIQPTYPLLRMDVKYRGMDGLGGHLKIETGYLRRMPILKVDARERFHHMGTGEDLMVLTPQKEELFSNKVATFLKRGKSRDLFDIYNISKCRFDRGTFGKCLAVECIIHGIDPKTPGITRQRIPVAADRELRSIVRGGIVPPDLVDTATSFIEGSLQEINISHGDFLSAFKMEGRIDVNALDKSERELNPSLENHPSILWALEKRRIGRTGRKQR